MEIRLQKAANGKGCEEVERRSVGHFSKEFSWEEKVVEGERQELGVSMEKGCFSKM